MTNDLDAESDAVQDYADLEHHCAVLTADLATAIAALERIDTVVHQSATGRLEAIRSIVRDALANLRGDR